MIWRSSTNIQDRVFAAVVYLFALYDSWSFSIFLVKQFPILQWVSILLIPIEFIYGALGLVVGRFASLIVFFILFLAVVRNERISHFIRFNTLQSILIGILLSLLGIMTNVILMPLFAPTFPLIIETLFNVIFLGSLAACLYSIIQSARGLYAEMPLISDAAYSQVR